VAPGRLDERWRPVPTLAGVEVTSTAGGPIYSVSAERTAQCQAQPIGTATLGVYRTAWPGTERSDRGGDRYADGLPTPGSATGRSSSGAAANGASGDPDGDGRTNAQEYTDGTHPRGLELTFLAEGATGAFFATRLAIANPSPTPALVLTRFQKTDGTTIADYRTIAAMARTTIDVGTLAGLEAAEFSTVVESDVEVVVDRTLTWNTNGYGSHAERGILTRTATEWYFAEGATHSGFSLFYLIQNPNAQAATVEVLPPSAARTACISVNHSRASTSGSTTSTSIRHWQAGASGVGDALSRRPVIAERACTHTPGHRCTRAQADGRRRTGPPRAMARSSTCSCCSTPTTDAQVNACLLPGGQTLEGLPRRPTAVRTSGHFEDSAPGTG
jgi:hypothetical protein